MEASDLTLRDARREDFVAIVDLVTSVLAEFGFAFDPDRFDRDLAEPETYFQPDCGIRVLVAPGGRILGVVGVTPETPEVSRLRKLYISPELRGGGWGRRLLDDAIEFARERGSHTMIVETSSRLSAAVRLYERAGFRPTGPARPGETCDRELILPL